MSDKIYKELQDLSKRAYNPYSKFAVAAILITKDNEKFYGTNIENASYGATICAEQSAISAAISKGVSPKKFKEIHIMGNFGETFTSPCGICRQIINEFFSKNAKIFLHFNNKFKSFNKNELLPLSFGKEKVNT